jgi:hypothetical protein
MMSSHRSAPRKRDWSSVYLGLLALWGVVGGEGGEGGEILMVVALLHAFIRKKGSQDSYNITACTMSGHYGNLCTWSEHIHHEGVDPVLQNRHLHNSQSL